jgi:HD-GYP domain-containing protein (c-di-GMP phosphodiesterase class II)
MKLGNSLPSSSLNVTTLSLIIGKRLGYKEDRLERLGLGAFLHDIGKVKVPNSILNKPGELTDSEFEEVKKHTIYGYEILKPQDSVPETSARIAYQHHERCDGSGYPKGITRRFIDEGSRIVAIADVFDSMINDRVYRPGIKVNEVIEYLYSTVTQNKLDREIVKMFLEIITPYPIGTKVKLSIGCEAVVVKINKDAKLRPVVKILNINSLNEAIEVDLKKNLSIDIV